MKALYEEKTSTFWRNDIASSNGNSRRLWQTFENALGDATNDDAGDNTAEDSPRSSVTRSSQSREYHDHTTT